MNEHLHRHGRDIRSPEEGKYFSPTAIKIGGSTVAERTNIVRDIAFLYSSGVPVLVVHGGGIEIDRALKEQNVFSKKIEGERITDALTLKVVISVLDNINAQIVGQLTALGIPAEGLNSSSGLLQGEIENPVLGFVGKITRVGKEILARKINEKIVPVISPIAVTQNAPQLLNVNADTVAGAVASSLGLDLISLTDVDGVLDVGGNLIPELSYENYQKLQQSGVITRGMMPKLKPSFVAAKSGQVFICQSPELIKVFPGNAKGTFIKV